jgi:glycosyltransferase involved in cell wall biosynthesis
LFTPHGLPWVHSFVSAITDDVAERLLLRRTAAVLCVSHHEVAAWNRRDTSERITYLPNPVPPLEFTRDRAGSVVVREGAAPTRTILVPTGYDPIKRIEVVIEALALLPEPRPDVAIVGAVTRADYRDRMMALAAERGVSRNIRFDKEIRNVRAALREASLVVLPSFSEGLPVVGLEAISEGACVAWSRIGGHVELFGDAGAPFWTAAELATIIAADHQEASLACRQSWLAEYRRSAERIRSEYWTELEANFRSGHT